MSQHIARFNPYSMDDETVLAVATGRKQPLSVVLETLADNLSGNEQQHLMVVGPRGRGKSFFLKYLRIMFERDERFQHCLFISLPEEQSNVRFASDLVRMILSQINGEGFRSVTPLWREPEELWQNSVNELEAYCRQQAAEHEGKFLLVAVVENFQDLLERLDETGEHRIRHLMEHLPQFTLIGATPYARVDSDYNRPIFHIFKEIQIQPWPEESYLKYFRRRQQLESERTGKTWTEAELRFKEAKLRAISQYTGGSPRMAVVLSNLLLDENVVSTARTLYGLVDELTPYYQDLVKDIPSNSLALFDALIRLGENLSQSELASRLGASQNDISKAFRWLHDNGYVVGAKRTNSKEFRYAVSDRVFVLYYLRREVYHDVRYTPVWLLADFLTAFYSEEELHRHSLYQIIAEPSADAEDLVRVWMRKKGIGEEAYTHDRNLEEMLRAAGVTDNSFMNVGLELFEQGKLEECLKYCEGLITKEKDDLNIYAWSCKGLILTALNSFNSAIECHEKSCSYCEQQKNMQVLAINIECIGRNLINLECFAEAIDQYKKAFLIWQQKRSIDKQAESLESIGWCLQKLNQHSKSNEFYQKAKLLRAEERNISGQAWDLSRIGRNFEALDSYMEAVEYYTNSLLLWEQEGDLSQQAWNLGKIGWNLGALARHTEAVPFYQKALSLSRQEGNIFQQAWNLENIGWSLNKCSNYIESIEYHQMALILREQEGDVSQQSWNLGHVGSNLQKLGRLTEAIEKYQKAVALIEQEGNLSEIVSNLEKIGWLLTETNRHLEAIEYHNKALEFIKPLKNNEEQNWNLGHISKNLFLIGNDDAAFIIWQNKAQRSPKAFKQWGDAIHHLEKSDDSATAFVLANRILRRLPQEAPAEEIPTLLSVFFADLIEMQISEPLLRDIAEEAMLIFQEPAQRVSAEAALHVSEFLTAQRIGQGELYLEKLHPDMAIAVRAVAREAKLDK